MTDWANISFRASELLFTANELEACYVLDQAKLSSQPLLAGHELLSLELPQSFILRGQKGKLERARAQVEGAINSVLGDSLTVQIEFVEGPGHFGALSVHERLQRIKDIYRGISTQDLVNYCGLEFEILREELLGDPRIAPILPTWIRQNRNQEEFWQFIKLKFATYAERRQFLSEELAKPLEIAETISPYPTDALVQIAIADISSGYVLELWNKALARRESDPSGAITIARTLIEAVAKHVIDQFDEGEFFYAPTDDPGKLVKTALKALGIHESQIGEQLKHISGGLVQLASGIGSLRNSTSDSHGKGKSFNLPDSITSTLAINSAAVIAYFLLSTLASHE